MAIALGRLAVVLPDWFAGVPPRYPGQYLGRLFFALMQVPLLSVMLLALGTPSGPLPRWRRVLPWALLAVSLAALVLDARQG